MKSERPQFLHKREMFFCCDSHSCAPEWSHRIRETFQGLPNDVCGEASGRPAILEGELLGKLETRVSVVLVTRALRPPPCPRSMSWGGPSAAAEVAELWFSNHGSATVTVNVALIYVSAVGPVQSSRCAMRRAGSLEGLRTMRLGWLVWAAFVLCRLTSCSPFVLLRIIARHSCSCERVDRPRNFSELTLVFLRMRLAFTTRVRLVFRLHFESWRKHQDRGHY